MNTAFQHNRRENQRYALKKGVFACLVPEFHVGSIVDISSSGIAMNMPYVGMTTQFETEEANHRLDIVTVNSEKRKVNSVPVKLIYSRKQAESDILGINKSFHLGLKVKLQDDHWNKLFSYFVNNYSLEKDNWF